jgi:phosphate starvation-inducible protein PhoH and related proteins
VSFQRLTAHDVVRHKLVGEIVAKYDEFDARQPHVNGRSAVDDAR